MKYKALISFAGKVSMTMGEVREIADSSVAKDLLQAKYIEEIKEGNAENNVQEVHEENNEVQEIHEESNEVQEVIESVEEVKKEKKVTSNEQKHKNK